MELHDVPQPTSCDAGERKALSGFGDRLINPAVLLLSSLLLSSLLYVLTLETLLRRVRYKEAGPVLRGIPFAGPLSAKVSEYANDINDFLFIEKHGCYPSLHPQKAWGLVLPKIAFFLILFLEIKLGANYERKWPGNRSDLPMEQI